MTRTHIRKKFLSTAILFVGAGVFLFGASVSAQPLQLFGRAVGLDCNWAAGETFGLGAFTKLALNVLKFIWGILGSLALVMFVWGGFLWLTARGEENQIKQGWDTLINAVIGLLIVLGSWLIINTIILALTDPGNWTHVAQVFNEDWTNRVEGDICVKVAAHVKSTGIAAIAGDRCTPVCNASDQYCHGENCEALGSPPGGAVCKPKRGLNNNCFITCVGQCQSGLTCKKDGSTGLTKCLSDISAAPTCSPPCNTATHYCYDTRFGLQSPETPYCEKKLGKGLSCMSPDFSEQCEPDLVCRVAPQGNFQCLEPLSVGPIASPPDQCTPSCNSTQYCYDNSFVPVLVSANCQDKLEQESLCQKTIQCKSGLECRNDSSGIRKCLPIATSGDGICLVIFKDQKTDLLQQYSINLRSRQACDSTIIFGKYIVNKAWCLPVIDVTMALSQCNASPGDCKNKTCVGGWQSFSVLQ